MTSVTVIQAVSGVLFVAVLEASIQRRHSSFLSCLQLLYFAGTRSPRCRCQAVLATERGAANERSY